jgi:hypothetical protein
VIQASAFTGRSGLDPFDSGERYLFVPYKGSGSVFYDNACTGTARFGPKLETFRKIFPDLERTPAEGQTPADSEPSDLGWFPLSGGLVALLGIGRLLARRRAESR